MFFVKFYFDNIYTDLQKLFQVRSKSELPMIFLTRFSGNELLKYKFNYPNINETNILRFIDDFDNHKINPFYLSEEQPEDEKDSTTETGLVKKLTGKNHNSFIWDQKGKDVIIFLCSERDQYLCEVPKTVFLFVAKWLEQYKDI